MPKNGSWLFEWAAAKVRDLLSHEEAMPVIASEAKQSMAPRCAD